MISYGKSKWIPQMKQLWHQVFGDDKEYLDSFFSNIYRDDNTLVYVAGEKVVAILFIVPYQFHRAGVMEKAVYLYALATSPEYRGRGIMAELINKSIAISRERKYSFLFLVPSNQTLFGYYKKFGFRECSFWEKIEKDSDVIRDSAQSANIVQAQEVTHKKIQFISADQKQLWNAYKNSTYPVENRIILTKEQNAFYLEQLKREGGQAYVFDMIKERDGYVFLKYQDSLLEVFETNVDEQQWKLFERALLDKYTFRHVIFHQPPSIREAEYKTMKSEFAMAYDLKGNELPELYINRVLM